MTQAYSNVSVHVTYMNSGDTIKKAARILKGTLTLPSRNLSFRSTARLYQLPTERLIERLSNLSTHQGTLDDSVLNIATTQFQNLLIGQHTLRLLPVCK